MRIPAFMAAFMLLALPAWAGELLDQVVVTVNGNSLLQSDWDAEVRYEALMAGRPMDDLSQAEREAALNRIIDQELVREQAYGVDMKPVTTAEVDDQMNGLREQYEHDHPGLSWNAAVAKYGFSEADLRQRVQAELTQLRIVDEKLRPSVEVDPSEVEAYYKDKIASQKAGGHAAGFDEIKDKIRELLVQQKITQALDAWLESLRTQANIHRIVPRVEGGAANP